MYDESVLYFFRFLDFNVTTSERFQAYMLCLFLVCLCARPRSVVRASHLRLLLTQMYCYSFSIHMIAFILAHRCWYSVFVHSPRLHLPLEWLAPSRPLFSHQQHATYPRPERMLFDLLLVMNIIFCMVLRRVWRWITLDCQVPEMPKERCRLYNMHYRMYIKYQISRRQRPGRICKE